MKVAINRDGLVLRGLLEGTTKSQVDTLAIIMHGFLSDLHAKVPEGVASQLNQAGIPTLRFNFDGCGDSDGQFENMTIFSEILDAIAVIKYAKQKLGAKHLYLIGHSQGGVVASMVAAYYHDLIDKLVLLSPAASLKMDAAYGKVMGVSYDPLHIPDSVQVRPTKLVGGAYFRTAQLMPIYETAQHYDKPTLIIVGQSDSIVPAKYGAKYNTIMPKTTFYQLKGAEHDLSGDNNQQEQAFHLVEKFLTTNNNQ